MESQKLATKYLNLALIAFAGFLGELVLYVVLLQLRPHIHLSETMQIITIRIILYLLYGGLAYWLVQKVKREHGSEIFTQKAKIKPWQWIAVIFLLGLSFARSYASWNGFKVLKEFQYNGLFPFILQYIYYLFEMALVTLVVVFSQRAGELRFKNMNIPYGGIFCVITWGAIHFITKGFSLGILGICLQAVIFGVTYLLLGKDIKKSYVIMLLMFLL